ncbi:MAG: hypothetical protein EBX52_00925 [Proteobacteria bacterium]|nr:hypothetical protein [Pseudomonadota bacterium]
MPPVAGLKKGMLKFCWIFKVLVATSLLAASVYARSSKANENRPYRLGVVLVVDQFRADYLMRFKDRFLPVAGEAKGYRFLTDKGAYFPLADQGLLQDMTGPGHSAILSGAYPYRHGISTNVWFDRDAKREAYCVEDEGAHVIGSEGVVKDARIGVSPKNFNASTVGDELKNVNRASRVVSISLKDRAAILMGGKRTDYTLWFDDKHCQWASSDFYLQKLPEFALRENEKLKHEHGGKFDFGSRQGIEVCSKDALRSPWGIRKTFDFAIDAVEALGLGKGKDTDLLAVSLSSHDFLGHQLGPNHADMEEITVEEDRLVSDFLNRLSKRVPGGMESIFVVLTGDHGIPPVPLPKERVPSENLPVDEIRTAVEKAMTQAYGKPAGGKWVESEIEAQVYFNAEAMRSAGITPSQAVKPVREALLRERYADQVWARDEILYDRKIPAGEYGVVADRTLTRRSGDLVVVLKPYYFSDSYPVSHMTFYSYDRYVPLVFYGKTFKRGVHRQIVNVVDIAPTLSRVLDVIPPSQSEGRVLTEALR